jgi:gliding motility-associated-like protein/uncharacterized repeat protein (TIGR01451 family)
MPGNYSVTVVDLTSTCKTSGMVSVGVHTLVTISATIVPATCNGETANNDGSISVSNFGTLDKFDLVNASSYTGTATYSTAALIPSNGVISNNLSNPTATVAFTIRLFDAEGCTKDTTLILQPTDCVPKTLGVAKDVSQPIPNADGTYDMTYTVVVKNYDTHAITNVSFVENLSATFPLPSTYTVVTAPVITPATGTGLALTTGFDGAAQTLLTDSLNSSMLAGESDIIVFRVRVNANGFFGPFNNFVAGKALTSASLTVRDSSTAGLNPDPDGDGNPMNNTYATIVNLLPEAAFAITKTGTVGAKQHDSSYDITYTVTAHNAGNDTLYNVTLKDSLFEKAIKYPATYTIKSEPAANANLLANANFDGKADINLTSPLSKLPPGASNTIVFVINVKPDTVTSVKNTAYGNCINRNNVLVSDTSTVVLAIRNPTLFIPEGFSPNGDAINEFFVIPGLPTTGDNAFTVYNRWGNKVYHKANYDNTWEGYPNVGGVIGGEKLPQGTYYYILEMKGSNLKPITGFIELQY